MKALKRLRTELSGQRVLHDGWLLGLLVLNGLFLTFLIGWSVTHIHHTEISIPVRFSSLTNFDQLGPWYQLYEVPVIGALVFAVNLFFATLIHKRNRLMSIFLMMVSLLVLVLASAIIIGFTVVNYGTG